MPIPTTFEFAGLNVSTESCTYCSKFSFDFSKIGLTCKTFGSVDPLPTLNIFLLAGLGSESLSKYNNFKLKGRPVLAQQLDQNCACCILPLSLVAKVQVSFMMTEVPDRRPCNANKLSHVTADWLFWPDVRVGPVPTWRRAPPGRAAAHCLHKNAKDSPKQCES